MSAHEGLTAEWKRGTVEDVMVQMMSASETAAAIRPDSGVPITERTSYPAFSPSSASCSSFTSACSLPVSRRATMVIFRSVGTVFVRTCAWYFACAPEPKRTSEMAVEDTAGRDWMKRAEAAKGDDLSVPGEVATCEDG